MRIPPSILGQRREDELSRCSEGMVDEDQLKSAAEGAVLEYKGLDAAALLDDEQKDYIVDLQGIISFACRPGVPSAPTSRWSAARTASSDRTAPARRRC